MGHALSLVKPPVITGIGVGIHHSDKPDDYCGSGRWRLHLYSTPLVIVADGRQYDIVPGHAALWRPEVELQARFRGRSVHMCAHFEVASKGDEVILPGLQDLAGRFAAVDGALQEAAGWFPRSPHRAEARLWDVLWQLVEPEKPGPERAGHPALERARAHIHAQLNRELGIAAIADAAGCSANHLLRLFRREQGTTIVAFVRECRVRRAEYLLRHSTIPIKDIAAEVGIPDLHFFNKTMRRELGKSPRDIRSS